MSSKDLKNFLDAVDVVKQGYTCVVCSELCVEPVVLSKCFHMICSQHFESLKTCPSCEVALDDCTLFTDDRLKKCVNSTRELDAIFEEARVNLQTEIKDISKKRKKTKDGTEHNENSKNTSQKSVSRTEKDNENWKATDLAPTQTVSDVNTSVISVASSKATKSLEKRNTKGETMLHIACRLGKSDRVGELLSQGANPNTKDNAGWTPLHEVVQIGRFDLLQLLLKHNTLINVPGQANETPLHEAVRYNHKEIAVELVKNGANINARNIKGETPLELASQEMKQIVLEAAENIIQTQSINIDHISIHQSTLDYDDIKVYNVSEYHNVSTKLSTLMKHYPNLHIEQKFTKKVTHLVVDTGEDYVCDSTMDVLQGIVNGIWIISSYWVIRSTNETLKPFENFEVIGVGNKSNNGPKQARYNKYKQLPGIFNGCHFHLHKFNTKYEISKILVLTKTCLTKLITDAGGIVLRRVPNPESIPESEKLVPYHAKKDGKLVNCSHYIIFKDIYEPMYNMQHLKALPIGWLIECIEKYELCEPWSL